MISLRSIILFTSLVVIALLAWAAVHQQNTTMASIVSLSNKAQCLTSNDAPMQFIKGGPLRLGDAGVYGEETPVINTQVQDFMLSRHEVTNQQFVEFVNATGYVTVAERQADPAMYPGIDASLLKPGSAVFVGLSDAVKSGKLLNWWVFKEGANWRNPYGENSDIEGLAYFPVVHIALEDAQAYAAWKGHRLPTEAEFEYAARSKLVGSRYARGDQLKVEGQYQANTWQGVFPFSDDGDDGYVGLAPVGCYSANSYGVYDLIGNVWEWTSSVYYPLHYAASEIPAYLPPSGYAPEQPNIAVGVIKGGSYLCSPDYCARYRPAARQAQDTGLGTSHIGFRTAMDIPTAD